MLKHVWFPKSIDHLDPWFGDGIHDFLKVKPPFHYSGLIDLVLSSQLTWTCLNMFEHVWTPFPLWIFCMVTIPKIFVNMTTPYWRTPPFISLGGEPTSGDIFGKANCGCPGRRLFATWMTLQMCNFHEDFMLVGGWPTPLKNMKVSWDYDIPNIWKNKNVPNHQPVWIISDSWAEELQCLQFMAWDSANTTNIHVETVWNSALLGDWLFNNSGM